MFWEWGLVVFGGDTAIYLFFYLFSFSLVFSNASDGDTKILCTYSFLLESFRTKNSGFKEALTPLEHLVTCVPDAGMENQQLKTQRSMPETLTTSGPTCLPSDFTGFTKQHASRVADI